MKQSHIKIVKEDRQKKYKASKQEEVVNNEAKQKVIFQLLVEQ